MSAATELDAPFEPPTARVEPFDVRLARKRVQALRAALLESTRRWLACHADWRVAELERTRAALRGLPNTGAVSALERRLTELSAECDSIRAHHEIGQGALRRAERVAVVADESGVRTRPVQP